MTELERLRAWVDAWETAERNELAWVSGLQGLDAEHWLQERKAHEQKLERARRHTKAALIRLVFWYRKRGY